MHVIPLIERTLIHIESKEFPLGLAVALIMLISPHISFRASFSEISLHNNIMFNREIFNLCIEIGIFQDEQRSWKNLESVHPWNCKNVD